MGVVAYVLISSGGSVFSDDSSTVQGGRVAVLPVMLPSALISRLFVPSLLL